MSVPPAVLQILNRMLDTGQEYGDLLNNVVPRASTELAALATDYALYVQRAGFSGTQLSALEVHLSDASLALKHAQFDLQQQLRDDLYSLRLLQDVVLSAAQEGASMNEAVRIAVDTFSSDMEHAHRNIGLQLRALVLRVRILANNIEIAAAQAGSSTASLQVDLFCSLASLLRTLTNRMHAAANDLGIFERTQNGNASSLRALLASDGSGAVA